MGAKLFLVNLRTLDSDLLAPRVCLYALVVFIRIHTVPYPKPPESRTHHNSLGLPETRRFINETTTYVTGAYPNPF
jgi:hypothetical protein